MSAASGKSSGRKNVKTEEPISKTKERPAKAGKKSQVVEKGAGEKSPEPGSKVENSSPLGSPAVIRQDSPGPIAPANEMS